jgi:hypothetical protein
MATQKRRASSKRRRYRRKLQIGGDVTQQEIDAMITKVEGLTAEIVELKRRIVEENGIPLEEPPSEEATGAVVNPLSLELPPVYNAETEPATPKELGNGSDTTYSAVDKEDEWTEGWEKAAPKEPAKEPAQELMPTPPQEPAQELMPTPPQEPAQEPTVDEIPPPIPEAQPVFENPDYDSTPLPSDVAVSEKYPTIRALKERFTVKKRDFDSMLRQKNKTPDQIKDLRKKYVALNGLNKRLHAAPSADQYIAMLRDESNKDTLGLLKGGRKTRKYKGGIRRQTKGKR